jgi:UDP-glucose 4-epimerase
MRVLITGGSGFIGTHLIKKLSSDGHDIYNLDKVHSPALPPDKQKIIDILDVDVNDNFFAGIDTIIHLAGMVSVPKSFEDPINSFGNNTFCTIKLLSAAHLHKIKKFIFSSSAAVYGSKEGTVSETDAAKPNSPYGLDKLASEKYIQMYCQQWDIDYLILRLFNIYGQGQNPQYAGVITAFNIALEKKESLIIYGDGEQTRDFISVNDVCNHISKLVSSTIKNEMFNIGTGNSISINTLAKQFGSSIIYKEAKKEVRHSCANVDKIKNLL